MCQASSPIRVDEWSKCILCNVDCVCLLNCFHIHQLATSTLTSYTYTLGSAIVYHWPRKFVQMNNQDPGNPNNRSITLFSTNGQLVTPEQYVQNQRRISDVVQLAQALTSRNDAGLMRYMEEQRRKVTEGLAAA